MINLRTAIATAAMAATAVAGVPSKPFRGDASNTGSFGVAAGLRDATQMSEREQASLAKQWHRNAHTALAAAKFTSPIVNTVTGEVEGYVAVVQKGALVSTVLEVVGIDGKVNIVTTDAALIAAVNSLSKGAETAANVAIAGVALRNCKGGNGSGTADKIVNNVTALGGQGGQGGSKGNVSNIVGSTITKVTNTATGSGQVKADGNIGFGQNLNGANTALSGGSAQNFTNNTSSAGVSGNGNGAAGGTTGTVGKRALHSPKP